MRYPTVDSWGHVETEFEAKAVKAAVDILNASETVGAMEENGNWHHAADIRKDIASGVHVAQIDEWKTSKYDDNFEEATCTICGSELEREKQ